MHVVIKTPSQLTTEEADWCRRTNLGDRGQMQMEFNLYRDCPDLAECHNVHCFLLLDERFSNYRQFVAWALLFNGTVYFYTKPYARNRGHGTTLMRAVKTIESTPEVCPWTYESGGFFSKFDVIPQYGEYYLTSKPKVC